ncbi:DUF6153 family protein [Micromonospora thermarum]|uniref:DUF6153 family protein n=1 Tax=Micromonospora thermarum TaxID=2720024 RepID=UPI002103FE55|nr:DUF6153 family protein [Micromonospora thermarum]
MLVVLLALGVCGMHTLGHIGDAGHHPAAAMFHAEDGMAMVVPHTGTDQLSAASVGEESPGHGVNLDLFAVCLAVLGAAGVVLWATRRGPVRRAPHSRLRRTVWSPQPSGRGPPVAPIGLRLAVASVSRT